MKYRVIALSVGGRGNKIFSAGDIVTAENFPPGNCPELVEKGFLEPILEPKFEKVPEKEPDKQPRKRGRRAKGRD